MISVSDYRYLRVFVEAAVFALLTLAALALLSVVTGAQGRVMAVSVNYLGDGGGAPASLRSDAPPKPRYGL